MTFSTQRRVEFRDTDAAGIVHFAAFFPMMESAEHEMLRSLGIDVLPSDADGVTWPRVAASCSYSKAARFEDLLTIEIGVAEIGETSVRYRFRFLRQEELIAEGEMTAVCCQLKRHDPATGPTKGNDPQSGGLKKVPIPEAIRQKLSTHH